MLRVGRERLDEPFLPSRRAQGSRNEDGARLPREASPTEVAKDGQHNNDDENDPKPGRHVILSLGGRRLYGEPTRFAMCAAYADVELAVAVLRSSSSPLGAGHRSGSLRRSTTDVVGSRVRQSSGPVLPAWERGF